MILRFITTIILLAISASICSGQNDTTISFVNFYPGPDIYELEGHSALRIVMPQGDFAVSYGTYDFDQPNFVYRFVKGETDYWVTIVPWQHMLEAYRRAGRRIVEHHLDLSPSQKQNLISLISENLLPANRTYRYNYVKDNCATRPLRIVECAIGDSIILGPPTDDTDGDQTFRSIMRNYHRNYPWYQFGIDLALGSGIDYIINNREKAFAPVILDNQLKNATVNGSRLVTTSKAINDTNPDNAILGPTPWYATPMSAACLLLCLTVIITIRDLRNKRLTRWFDALLYTIFGIAGLLITFLVFISVHEATSPNILLLWLNPLCFIPVIFIWINRYKIIFFSYQIVNFVALIILALLWIIGIQYCNTAFIPLILCDAIRSMSYIYLTIKNIRCQN